MDAGDREEFARSLRHAVETSNGPGLDAALAEIGWADALATDARYAVTTLFELQGSVLASSSSLEQLFAGSLGLTVAPDAGVVFPPFGRWCPPGVLAEGRLVISGLGKSSLLTRETALVVATQPAAEFVYSVPRNDLTIRPVRGIDPDLGLVEVTGTVDGELAGTGVTPPTWSSAVALAQLAVGHELVGTAGRMLELAREHALERVQFGQAISGFQAVRHRLAETLVAIESADAVLGAAWEDGAPGSAAVAKSLSGRGARTASRHCQQVLAGIGFTTEHEFQRHVRRALALDGLFGSSRSLTGELGATLLAERKMPDFAPL